jgi:hypothetical protein
VNINHLRLGSPEARRGIGNHHLMLDDLDSMIIECELYRIGRTMHWQGDYATAAEPASSCRRRSRSRTLIGTTTTLACHQPAKKLAVRTVTGLASITDPDDLLRRGSKIFEPLRLMRPVGTDMVGKTKGEPGPYLAHGRASHT